eukprot:scaffold624727_cov20-Prasinocladus_malaysianus.AAC.1
MMIGSCVTTDIDSLDGKWKCWCSYSYSYSTAITARMTCTADSMQYIITGTPGRRHGPGSDGNESGLRTT